LDFEEPEHRKGSPSKMRLQKRGSRAYKRGRKFSDGRRKTLTKTDEKKKKLDLKPKLYLFQIPEKEIEKKREKEDYSDVNGKAGKKSSKE